MTMTASEFPLSRRRLLQGVAASLAAGTAPASAAIDPSAIPLALTLKDEAGGPALAADLASQNGALRFRQGNRLRVSLTNTLNGAVLCDGYGFDGLQAVQPVLGQAPLEPGKTLTFDLPLTDAGTFALAATRLDGGGALRPTAAIVVAESNPLQADQDQVLLFGDSRQRADGRPLAPGADPAGATIAYRLNGQSNFDFPVKSNERLRVRLINGCHRNAVALQFPDHAVQVIALDSRPAEPFPARDGRLVLAPGGRIDALIDAAAAPGTTSPVLLFDGGGPKEIARLVYASGAPIRPQPLTPAGALPSASTRLELSGALRTEIQFATEAQPPNGWLTPDGMLAGRGQPAFRAKRGRTVVITLKNPTGKPAAFRLHGHHFRWLDRLDDGWKPFQLDTLVLDVGQTERIAFAAQYPGAWLMESAALDWSAPKLLRWFAID